MTNENVRWYWYDRLLDRTLLRLIPREIKPNHITVFRVLMTPVVWLFLWREEWELSILIFLAVAFTDVLDGSLARTRKQITLWGTAADPAADKLLVGSVVVIFVAREINLLFAVIIVLIEVLLIVSGIIRRNRGVYVSANWWGKIKMLLQVTGVTALLIAKWSGVDFFVPFSIGSFSLAVIFAIISLLTYGI